MLKKKKKKHPKTNHTLKIAITNNEISIGEYKSLLGPRNRSAL